MPPRGRSRARRRARAARARSLADAEPAEDLAEQIVAAELACDRGERLVRRAEVFGEQLQRRRSFAQMRMRAREVSLCGEQRLDVTLARDEGAFHARLRARDVEHGVLKQLDPFAGQRRKPDLVT